MKAAVAWVEAVVVEIERLEGNHTKVRRKKGKEKQFERENKTAIHEANSSSR